MFMQMICIKKKKKKVVKPRTQEAPSLQFLENWSASRQKILKIKSSFKAAPWNLKFEIWNFQSHH